MTEEIPDQTSSRFEIPVSVIVYYHQTYHRFFILVKLSELDSDVLALDCCLTHRLLHLIQYIEEMQPYRFILSTKTPLFVDRVHILNLLSTKTPLFVDEGLI